MGGPDWHDDGTIAEQYSDPENLNARVALHQRFSTADRNLQDWQFDQFDLPADADVLSLGAGDGDLWPSNRERVPGGWSVTVTDRSPGMVGAARDALGDGFRFGVADAASVPFAESTFHAVTANHMLYHVPDRQRALADIRRVLRPGGSLYATTNGAGHMAELKAVVDSVIERDLASSSMEFSLENGRAQLREQFDHVERRDREDGLRVTEVDPLVAYALSRPDVEESDAPALRGAFEDRLADGPFEVTKAVGMFVAR